MKKILALCDGEEDYLYHMADYLERKDTFPFAVHSFTDTRQLRKFMDCHEGELLLIAENAPCLALIDALFFCMHIVKSCNSLNNLPCHSSSLCDKGHIPCNRFFR